MITPLAERYVRAKVKGCHLSIVLLMAISCNLDNVGIGIAYGTRRVSIPFTSNLLIAVITTIGTFLSVILGQTMYIFLKPNIAKFAGAAIIICAGIWILVKEIISGKKDTYYYQDNVLIDNSSIVKTFFTKMVKILDNPFIADTDFSSHIDLKEGIALGLALSLNNVSNGIGAGMIGLNVMWLTLSVFILSIITIWVGIKVGHYYGHRFFGRLTEPAAGVLLVIIGIYEILS